MSEDARDFVVASFRAALVQMEHGPDFQDNLARGAERVRRAADAGARLVVLPEYFWAVLPEPPEEAARRADDVLSCLRDASRGGVAVAGNVVERGPEGALRNVGHVFEDGRHILAQAKMHPMPREAEGGIVGGTALRAADVGGRPTGLLVCADILYPEASRMLQLQGAEVLLNPVMSPWREEDDTKDARDAVFVARAWDAGAFVLKAAGFRKPQRAPDGRVFGVAGRSLAAAPWGLLARYADEFKDEVLVADLDFDRLERYRAHQRASFPARRPGSYAPLVEDADP